MSDKRGETGKMNVFSVEDKAFIFAPVIASETAAVVTERFKIINPFKVPCNVQFESKVC